MKYLLSAVLLGAILAPAAAHAESMTCVSKSDRGTYTAVKTGGKIVLKGKSWSANLTITEFRDDGYVTEVNKNLVFTNVSFINGKITFVRPEAEASVDDCTKGERTYYRGPAIDVPQQPRTNAVLEGIKAKCFGEWPGDYRMQDWCIDRQIEAYNALRQY